MDTLHFEPPSFHSPGGGRVVRDIDDARRIDAVNLSEPDVFMLRGRRLQAQFVGGALRHGVAKLRRLLGRAGRDSGAPCHPGCRSHA